ncbi:TPA: hypothetical protein QCX52_001620 [Bacillus toyonensis]|uniref:hypothetical protein n=1 Tax=Bacillus toyonensis TaxID=155322 RepID=UPI000BF69DC1|nr:hypothetical protein [Bacillus toyonensis]PGB41103.1 hypothetical protein COM07_07080 [Bacillus toyonensis]HDR7316698.1 hypothetical protein [Bacillus toyonensis]HDR7479771.1 hypothetical protein [Bacillus toyonensis]HDR7510717.1 hypothetical protein [Bacillus toyonensis]HDR7844732.1 hypothetical protein [Bacillus toyonensis]
MFVEYPNFIMPRHDTKIWRYMDFTKFVSLLDTEAIFFTRSDKFTDVFEGTYPKANNDLRGFKYPNFEKEDTRILKSILEPLSKTLRKFVLINCWHMNEYESAAMWDLYLKSSEGIAIQSTVGNLIKSFDNTEEHIHISKVNYIDFKREWMPEHDPLLPYIYKRKSFEHERELRLLHTLKFPTDEKGIIDYDGEPPVEYGGNIRCNIRNLVEKVYIAPSAPEWFADLVMSTCNKFNLNNVEIVKSELSEVPY